MIISETIIRGYLLLSKYRGFNYSIIITSKVAIMNDSKTPISNKEAPSSKVPTHRISKVNHGDHLYETGLGKKALANLRANPAAMSRSVNFHETSWL